MDGWKPSIIGVKEHDTSKYPLKGKHIAVECDKCHLPAGKDTIYKVKFAACTDCHKDAHDGQFAAAPYLNKCEDCHTVLDWHRSTFTIAKHRKARFALAGAHAAVPCSDCHKVGAAGRKDKILPFHFEDRTCTAGRPPLSTTTPGRISPCRVAMQAWLATNAISRRAWSMPSL